MGNWSFERLTQISNYYLQITGPQIAWQDKAEQLPNNNNLQTELDFSRTAP